MIKSLVRSFIDNLGLTRENLKWKVNVWSCYCGYNCRRYKCYLHDTVISASPQCHQCHQQTCFSWCTPSPVLSNCCHPAAPTLLVSPWWPLALSRSWTNTCLSLTRVTRVPTVISVLTACLRYLAPVVSETGGGALVIITWWTHTWETVVPEPRFSARAMSCHFNPIYPVLFQIENVSLIFPAYRF